MDKQIISLERYIRKKKLNQSVDVIIGLQDNLSSRIKLLDEKIKTYGTLGADLIKTYDSILEVEKQLSKLSPKIKMLHYCQLEIIKDISILIETFLLYFNAFRTDYKKVKENINKKPRFNLFNDEIEYIRNLGVKEIKTVFLFPDVTDYPLATHEKQYLRLQLSTACHRIKDSFKIICDFRIAYLEPYNKYKHTLSEHTGVFGILENNIYSNIYLTGEGKTRRNNNTLKTYIIGTGTDVKDYYSNVILSIFALFSFMNSCYWLYILNKGKRAYPILNKYFCPNIDSEKHRRIIDQVVSFKHGNVPSGKINTLWSNAAFQKVNKRMRSTYTTYIRKDIFALLVC